MIKVSNLKKCYGDRTVLSISDLTVNKGETVVIVGPNGSGKSTLLKIIAGVLEKSEGEISVNGDIFYMPQQCIPFSKSVKQNLIFSAKDKKDIEGRSDDILKLLSLSHLSQKKATTLSGGECQRLSLGRIIINKCDFLLLDEPSSAADIECTEIIEKAIKKYQEETGCGILMTTHSPKQAKKLASRVIILHDGKIAEKGSPVELLSNPKNDWTKKFIDMWKIDS